MGRFRDMSLSRWALLLSFLSLIWAPGMFLVGPMADLLARVGVNQEVLAVGIAAASVALALAAMVVGVWALALGQGASNRAATAGVFLGLITLLVVGIIAGAIAAFGPPR
jgi:hypothetical protein